MAKDKEKQYRPMTDREIHAAVELEKCRFLPGSWDKRFAHSMAGTGAASGEITEKQANWLWKLVYKYRRQIADRDLIREAERRKL